MGDTPVGKTENLPAPVIGTPVQVHRLRLEEQIAEKKYLLARTKAELEQFINGKVKGIQAHCIMLEREISALQAQMDSLDKFGTQDIIDVTTLNN